MTDSLLLAVHAFASRVLMSLSVDETLLQHGYIGCLKVHGTHVTTNNSTNNNVVFFFVSGLKIVYHNND